MLEIKHTATEMKNAFDELINTVDCKQTSENSVVGNNVNKNV